MRHVDEGTIHAWLDEQITEPAEAARIEEHLALCAECAARLAAERDIFERAEALLASTTPAVEQPGFETLLARAGSMPAASPARRGASFRDMRWHDLGRRAGLAASLALAVGLGWTARDLTSDTPTPLDAPAAEADRSAATPTKSSQPVEAPTESAARRVIAAPTQPPLRAADTRARLSAPPAPAPVAPERNSASSVTVTGETAAVDLQSVRQAPAAPPPPATAPLAALTESVAVTRPEIPALSGDATAADVARATTEWRRLPRTEAAARTGMALFGIDGLGPAATELSGDGMLVRTTYRLATGDVVELVQQRLPGGRGRTGEPVVDGAVSRSLAGGRGGIVADRARPVRRAWSSIRGDVRLTMQTTGDGVDLDGLAERLRED